MKAVRRSHADEELDVDTVDFDATSKPALAKPKPAHLDQQTYELKLLSDDPPLNTTLSTLGQRPRSSIQQLPPVDKGKRAWGYLAGAFLVEAFVWGMGIVWLSMRIKVNLNTF